MCGFTFKRIKSLLKNMLMLVCIAIFTLILSNEVHAEKYYSYVFDFGNVEKRYYVPGDEGTYSYNNTYEDCKFIITTFEDESITILDKNIIGYSESDEHDHNVDDIIINNYTSISNSSTNSYLFNFLQYLANCSSNTSSKSKVMNKIKIFLYAIVDADEYEILLDSKKTKVKGANVNSLYIAKNTKFFTYNENEKYGPNGILSYIQDKEYPDYFWVSDNGEGGANVKQNYRDFFFNNEDYTPLSFEINKKSIAIVKSKTSDSELPLSYFMSNDTNICQSITDAIKNTLNEQINSAYSEMKREIGIMSIDGVHATYNGFDISAEKDSEKIKVTLTNSNNASEKFSFYYTQNPTSNVKFTSNTKHIGNHYYVPSDSFTLLGYENADNTNASFIKRKMTNSSDYMIDVVNADGNIITSVYEKLVQDKIKLENISLINEDEYEYEKDGYKLKINKTNKTITVYEQASSKFIVKINYDYDDENNKQNGWYLFNGGFGKPEKDFCCMGTFGLALKVTTDENSVVYKPINDANTKYLALIKSLPAFDYKFLCPKNCNTYNNRYTNMIEQYLSNNNKRIVLNLYNLNEYIVTEEEFDLNGDFGTLLVENVDITALICDANPELMKSLEKSSYGNISATILDFFGVDGTRAKGLKYINDVVFKYGIPIALFTLFLSLIGLVIFSLLNSQDSKQRVLIKERITHILVGVILLSSIAILMTFCISYVEKNMQTLYSEINNDNAEAYEDSYASPGQTNWILEIVFDVMDDITTYIDKFIQDVLNPYISKTESVASIGTLILYLPKNDIGEYDYDTLSIAPFTMTEWELYMMGYQLLTVVSIAILLLAAIKNSGSMIIFAGDSQKIAEVKKDYLRYAVAVIGILIAPYIIRLILLICNCLTLLVPLDNDVPSKIRLYFDPEHYGYLGSAGNFLASLTTLKIFIIFLVRKVMITFMFIASPVIFAVWALSSKVRSFSLWLGELITNAMTQFSYAVILFIIVVISAGNTNPFMCLILVNMFIKLGDFLKDSLQGIIQKWGGINESEIADEVGNHVKTIGQNTIMAPKKIANFTGKAMIGAATFGDRKGVSNGWRITRNIGGILNGNFNITTKREMYEGIVRDMNQNKNMYAMLLEDARTRANYGGKDGELINKILNTDDALTEEELEQIRKYETSLDPIERRIASYYSIKQNYNDYTQLSDNALETANSLRKSKTQRTLEKETEKYVKKLTPQEAYKLFNDDREKDEKQVEKLLNQVESNQPMTDADKKELVSKLRDMISSVICDYYKISELAATNTEIKIGDNFIKKIHAGSSNPITNAEYLYNKLYDLDGPNTRIATMIEEINNNIKMREININRNI